MQITKFKSTYIDPDFKRQEWYTMAVRILSSSEILSLIEHQKKGRIILFTKVVLDKGIEYSWTINNATS
jgi:hypothetical protein